jgi:Cu-processing system ATP-binding protein
MTAANLIELKGLSKNFGAQCALDQIDLTVGPGECVALVGHNGAGKTTLIKLLLGLLEPSAGEIRVFGVQPIGRRREQNARRIGFLPEAISFQQQMTGLEALKFFARLKGVGTTDCEDRLAAVGLADASSKRLKAYSKGMRQRLGLAQALLGDPELLVLDEPTTGLDPDLRRELYQLLHVYRDAGTSIILSSHALSELEPHIDRAVVLKQGRLMGEGTIETLRAEAGLPIRIRVRGDQQSLSPITDQLPGIEARAINGHMVELTCLPEQKVPVIRWLTANGGRLDDLEIELPTLEHLYRFYRGDGEQVS